MGKRWKLQRVAEEDPGGFLGFTWKIRVMGWGGWAAFLFFSGAVLQWTIVGKTSRRPNDHGRSG